MHIHTPKQQRIIPDDQEAQVNAAFDEHIHREFGISNKLYPGFGT